MEVLLLTVWQAVAGYRKHSKHKLKDKDTSYLEVVGSRRRKKIKEKVGGEILVQSVKKVHQHILVSIALFTQIDSI